MKSCKFCAFSRTNRSEEGYYLDVEQVVQRAQEILTNIEQGEFTATGEPTITVSVQERTQEPYSQMSLFPGKDDPLRDMLREVDPDELSPRQAQEVLYALAGVLGREGKATCSLQ